MSGVRDNPASPSGLLRTPATTPGAASGPGTDLPTRSEIEGWIDDINDLSSSATQYRAAAERLEIAADGHVQQLSAPGGTEWEGEAADTARESGYDDRGVVYRAAGHMREMAKVADLGSATFTRSETALWTRSPRPNTTPFGLMKI